MAYGQVNADVIGTSVSGSNLGAGNASIMKNRIINGSMTIDQRNAGASVTPTAAGYTLDRWTAQLTQASKFSVQQNAGSVTPPVGFTKYLGCTSLSAYSVTSGDYFRIDQFIEGFNVADLGFGTANAKTITVSFQVYSSLTGTFGGVIANNAFNRCYPFSYTVSSANTWTTISVTIAGDTSGTWLTDNGIGLRLSFSLGAGSTYSGTAGAWSSSTLTQPTGSVSVVGTNGATFYITGVQLEVGSSATGFEYRQYTTELCLCQRYYQKWSGNPSRKWVMNGMTLADAVAYGCYPLKVTMRTEPTLSTTGTASDYCFYTGNTLLTCSSVPSINTSSVDTVNIGWVASGCGDGRASQMGSNTNSMYLGFNAEL